MLPSCLDSFLTLESVPNPNRTTDSDNNPKLVHVSYDQAKAKGDEEGKAGGKLVVEKTDQVMGSCAGAGYVTSSIKSTAVAQCSVVLGSGTQPQLPLLSGETKKKLFRACARDSRVGRAWAVSIACACTRDPPMSHFSSKVLDYKILDWGRKNHSTQDEATRNLSCD